MKQAQMLIATLLLTACTTQYDKWPEIDGANSKYAVVVGHFVGANYLPQFPQCLSADVVCIDPPPMALQFSVSESIYGEKVPSRLVTFTTSHYGKGGIDFGTRHPYLIQLITDGKTFVTPRYHMRRLAFSSRDQLAVPLDSPEDSVWWLPCKASQTLSLVSLKGPRKLVKIALDHLSNEQLEEMRDFIAVQGTSATIKRGVYIDDVKGALQGASKSEIDDGCQS